MERTLRELTPRTRWLAAVREVHDVVDSTNVVAEGRVAEGIADGALIIADRQTAGRGRLGRSFHSPGGRSLYLSLVLRAEMPTERIPLHVFAAATAVAATCRAHLPEAVRVEIKWPNDVLLDGRKTSGINLPVVMQGDRPAAAILGIGVNVNLLREEFPPELQPLATSLRMAGGRPLDRVAVAEELLHRLEAEIDDLRGGRVPSVLDRWSEWFRMVGSEVTVGGPGVPEQIEGTVEGLDHDGALLVRTAAGTQRVLAGDLSLRPRAGGEAPCS